jgi:glycosyltransferase involved in cell wall biosynthesis
MDTLPSRFGEDVPSRTQAGGGHPGPAGERPRSPTSLTIVTPTKNRPQLLRRALGSFASAAAQLEIIVVDDGSRLEISVSNQMACEALINCHYVRLEASRGAPGARNHGFRLSRGAYVWFMDDDDYATAQTVADALDAASIRTGSQVLLMPRTTVLDGTPIGSTVPADEADKLERYRRKGIEVTTSCALFPRQVLAQLNGWDERLRALHDTDLFLRAALITTFACIRTEPVRVDVGAPNRITNALFRSQIGKLQFLHKHWRRLPVRRRLRYIAQILLCMPLVRTARHRSKLAAIRSRGTLVTMPERPASGSADRALPRPPISVPIGPGGGGSVA